MDRFCRHLSKIKVFGFKVYYFKVLEHKVDWSLGILNLFELKFTQTFERVESLGEPSVVLLLLLQSDSAPYAAYRRIYQIIQVVFGHQNFAVAAIRTHYYRITTLVYWNKRICRSEYCRVVSSYWVCNNIFRLQWKIRD